MENYKYPPDPGSVFNDSSGREYRIIQELGSGGYNLCFKCATVDTNEYFVLKVANLNLENFPLDRIQERTGEVFQTYSNEINVVRRVDSELISKVVNIGLATFDLGNDDAQVPLVFTIQEFIDGQRLDDWLAQGKELSEFKGVKDARLFFDCIDKIIEALSVLHEQRIVHGDLWPGNVIVRNDGKFVLIDLGEAFLEEQIFEKKGTDKKYHAFLAPERFRGFNGLNFWRTPADIYSLGCTMYYIATGQEPPQPFIRTKGGESRAKSNLQLKSEIQKSLLSKNPVLFWQNPGIVDLIVVCMRPRVNGGGNGRADSLQLVKRQIGLFKQAAHRTEAPQKTKKKTKRDSEEIVQWLKSIATESSSFFEHMVGIRAEQTLELYNQLRSRVMQVSGRRDVLVEALIHAFNYAQEGEEITAVTSTAFWRRENFGPYGRVLTSLQMAAMRNVSINWVILLPKETSKLDSDVVTGHRRVANLLSSTDHHENYRVYCYKEVDNEIKFLRDSRRAFIVIRKGEETIRISPDYVDDKEPFVASLNFWRQPAMELELVETFDRFVKGSTPIEQYQTKANRKPGSQPLKST